MPPKGEILLINPSYTGLFKKISGSEWKAPPMGLAYIAAASEQEGHKVKLIDWDVDGLTEESFARIAKNGKFDVAGITATTPTIAHATSLARTIKRISPRTLVVLGGPHPSAAHSEVIRQDGVDVVVRGEGEETFKELVAEYLRAPTTPREIPGTIKKVGDKIITAAERPLLADLDSLPFPAWHLLNMDAYFRSHPLAKTARAASVLTSRGCPYRCGYCQKHVFGTKYRKHGVEYVIASLDLLRKKYRITEFLIVDDTFSLDRQRVFRFCDALIAKNWGLRWATPNGINIKTFDEEIAQAIKKAGCYSVSFGLESGNQKTLDYIGKQLRLEEAEAAFRIAKKVGLETVAFIIIGLPNETKADITRTLEFLKKIRPDVVDFHTLIPLPETRIYHELKEKNQILETDYSKYTFHDLPVYQTDWLSREEIAAAYSQAYLHYHLRPAYILQRLAKIRSLHDLAINLRGIHTLIKNFILNRPS